MARELLRLHEPHLTGNGTAHCQGCDRKTSKTALPDWPCNSYSLIAKTVLNLPASTDLLAVIKDMGAHYTSRTKLESFHLHVDPASPSSDQEDPTTLRALLIGGTGTSGKTCRIPNRFVALSVTTVNGYAQVYDAKDPDAEHLLAQANGDWQTFVEVVGLDPSSTGLIAHRQREPLPPLVEEFFKLLQNNHSRRQVVGQQWHDLMRILRRTGLLESVANSGIRRPSAS